MAQNSNARTLTIEGVVVGIPQVPVTLERPPPNDVDKVVPNPGLPRATATQTLDKPTGGDAPKNRTVLQQHVDFFDQDMDGKIYPSDTYRGFRRIGFNMFLSAYAVLVIHGTFSIPTQPRYIPDPFMSVNTAFIHSCKHGSDSESYDTEGRFVPEKYEEIFSKYDKDNKGGLYYRDLLKMMFGNANVWDPVGWTAEFMEWSALWLIAADDSGMVTREQIRQQYDGSLFYQLARKQEAKQEAKKKGKKQT